MKVFPLTLAVMGMVALMTSGCGGGGGGSSTGSTSPGFTSLYSFGSNLSTFNGRVRPVVLANGDIDTTATVSGAYVLDEFHNFGKGSVTSVPLNEGNPGFLGYFAVSPTTGLVYANIGNLVSGYSVYDIVNYLGSLSSAGGTVTGLVVDSKGDLWETNGSSLIEFNTSEAQVATIAVSSGASGLAQSLAIDASDNLYVGSLTTVSKYSSSGALLLRFSTSGDATAESSIAVDSADNIYTASASGTVGRYSAAGVLSVSGQNIGPLIAVDPNGNIYSAGDSIHVYRISGS